MESHYRVFGLSLVSEIEFPELLLGDPEANPDVEIRYGEVPEKLAGAVGSGRLWQTSPGMYLVNAGPAGRYLVRDGKHIVVHPDHKGPLDVLRLAILSAGLSILLHQRHLLPLHSSAMRTAAGAVLFMGMSGAGKSTLISAFVQRGYAMLADDMVGLRVESPGGILALPGFPRLKLRTDSAQALGQRTEDWLPAFGDPDKFIVPGKQGFGSEPSRVRAMYVIQPRPGAATHLEPLGHAGRFNAVLDHTWQKATLNGMGLREPHFRMAAHLAAEVHAARLYRPTEALAPQAAVELIEQDLEHIPKLV